MRVHRTGFVRTFKTLESSGFYERSVIPSTSPFPVIHGVTEKIGTTVIFYVSPPSRIPITHGTNEHHCVSLELGKFVPPIVGMSPMRKLIPAMVLLAVSSLCRPALCQDRIAWQSDLRQAQQLANQRGQLLLLHFWGENCGPCIRLEHYVFNRPEVIRAMGTNYVPVKINVNERPDVADHFRVTSMPVDVIITPEGKEVHRAVSPQNYNQYIAQLDQVAANFRAGTVTASTQTGAAPGGAAAPSAAAGATPSPEGQFQSAHPGTNPSPFAPNPSTRRNSDFQPSGAVAGNPPPSAPSTTVAANPRGGLASPSFMANPYGGNATPASSNAVSTQTGSAGGPAVPPGLPNRGGLNSPMAPRNGGASSASSANPASAQVPAGAGAPARSHTQTASFNLPPGAPPLIMDGFCPVSLIEGNEWKSGLAQCGAIHRGRTFLFAGQAEQQKFLAAPDRYSPVLSGLDAVRFVELGQFVEGKREFGVSFNDQIFLFADSESRDRFESNPFHYARAANEAMKISDQPSRPAAR